MKKIVMTGGGSAGHVTPNLALIPALQADGWQVDYIGSDQGIERDMIKAICVPYHPIRTGKLRRYFSWQNLLDPFQVLIGIFQAFKLLRRIKPAVVFSKGGFVALPVVIGAWLARVPIVAHESDCSFGLANRLTFPFVNIICVTFPMALDKFKHPNKVKVTGTPIRETLLQGERNKGLKFCGFEPHKPCLLVIGGSAGAQSINRCVREALPTLLPTMQIIHICGPNKIDKSLNQQVGYIQLEYAHDQLGDLFAASDWVVSRAGANVLYELLVLGKPHILIPLPLSQSRGDQIENAKYYEKLGTSYVIEEDNLNPETLAQAIQNVTLNRQKIIAAIAALDIHPAIQPILKIIEAFDLS